MLDALALLPASSLTVSDVSIADIPTINGLSALVSMTVQDAAGTIQTDLGQGANSALQQNNTGITGITFSGGTSVALTDTQAELVPAALALLPTNSLTVNDVSLTDVPTIAALASLAGMTVLDNAASVQTDLLEGASSVLEQSAGVITGISFSSGTSIALTDAQAEPVLAALAHLPAGSLTVSAVSVADVPAIDALSALAGMTVSDSTSNIQTDLIKGASSALQHNAGAITGVAYSSGTSIALTDAQAELALAALANLPANSLTISGVTVADVPTIAGLAALTNMSVSDAVGTVQTDLSSGTPALVANHGKISGITLTGGTTLTLTVAQIGAALPVLALTSSYLLSVNDTAINVQNDLALGASSVIVMRHTHIASSALTSSGTITLTESQVTASFVAGFLRITANLTGVTVTGATVAQIPTVVGLSLPGMTMTLSDSALNVQNDLANVSSKILTNISSVAGIVLPNASTITLSESQAIQSGVNTALNEASNLATFAVTGATVAQVGTVLALGVTNTSITISDTASHIQSDLQLGSDSVLTTNATAISGVSFSSGTLVALTDAQAELVLAALAFLPVDSLTVSNVSIGDMPSINDLPALASITVQDTAGIIQTDLIQGAGSLLQQDLAKITGITFSGGTAVALTDTQAEQVLATLALLPASSLIVSDVSLVDLPTIAGLSALTSMTVQDDASSVQTDLLKGRQLGAGAKRGGHHRDQLLQRYVGCTDRWAG